MVTDLDWLYKNKKTGLNDLNGLNDLGELKNFEYVSIRILLAHREPQSLLRTTEDKVVQFSVVLLFFHCGSLWALFKQKFSNIKKGNEC